MNWLTAEKKWGMLLTYCFDYFPSCSLSLSLSVWLQRTLPWGTFSSLRLMDPTESDDGPIMWVRPGEQMIPVADIPKSPFKRKRWVRLETVHKFIKPICWILLKRCTETETELAGMNVVCTGCKSQWCVCVFVCVPYWASSVLCTRRTAHEDRLWKTVPKHTHAFEAAAAVAAWSFVVAEQRRMRQLHPLCLSLSQCHCCLHISCVSLSHTHTWFLWGSPWERESVCVCLCLCVVCGSPLRWDHRYVNRVDIRRYFTWQTAKQGTAHTAHTASMQQLCCSCLCWLVVTSVVIYTVYFISDFRAERISRLTETWSATILLINKSYFLNKNANHLLLFSVFFHY